mmetsp:Transcript_61370/g.168480  ORF Transcript_61370/g.168480 Transcript_61370/m.168480 type:complete len:91 (-) Transcript_61370:96-368(-)
MAAVASTTCSEEQRNIIDMLLSAGAKTDTADNNGYTPFWAATACQNLVAMKLIRKARRTCTLSSSGSHRERRVLLQLLLLLLVLVRPSRP